MSKVTAGLNTLDPYADNANVQSELNNDVLSAQSSLVQRMSNPRLSALRAQNPFLPIVPFPNSVVNVMLTAYVPQDINLPQGTKFINIRSTGEYFASRNGVAQLPATTPSSDNGSTSFDPSQYIYVEEIRQFSLVSSMGGSNAVCISCFQQL